MSPDKELFEEAAEPAASKAPLAARMRPTSLDEIVGQEKVIGPGTTLRALIERDELRSAILWGPAGTGKTSIAYIVAERTKAPVEKLSAISSGVADVRKVIASARKYGRTVLFLDEIHRFNRAQQDAFLGAVEEGVLILIGATTENPFFEVNSPLLSRSLLFRLEGLEPENIRTILDRALSDTERGIPGAQAADAALEWIAEKCGGDARVSLNAIEAGAELAAARGDNKITLEDAQAALARRAMRYDKKQDRHYDIISAFIKSLRGSDPDAGLYWLAEMIEGGEDPRFIARRMIILASEDIGMADPHALVVAVAAARAVEHVGLPEVGLNLAHVVIYLATAPKSNAVATALTKAMDDARKRSFEVPAHLRQSDPQQMRQLRSQGKGYKYTHDHPDAEQEFRPPELEGRKYYEPDR